MIALGYDYGTTNSIIVRFDRDIVSDRIKNKRKSSRMEDGQSPKRVVNNQVHDNADALRCIRSFTKSMFGEVKNYLPDEDVVVTLTIPNTFRDVECLRMRDVVMEACCDSEVFGTRLQDTDLHILPEPIAAALYYVYLAGNEEMDGNERYLVVYDVGGGTSDFAVIGYSIRKTSDGKKDIRFSVICTTGELVLGGDDFDRITEDYVLGVLEYNKGIAVDSEIKRVVKRDCEAIKCRVAYGDYMHTLQVDGRSVVEGGLTLSKVIFENKMKQSDVMNAFRSNAAQLLNAFKQKLAERGKSLDYALRMSTILPVGGSSKIPLLQKVMEDVFKCCVVDEFDFGEGARFESVSRGAAIYSAWKAGMLQDIASIAIEDRVLHRISYMWGDYRLHTCVDKNFPSGEYSETLRPSGLQARSDGTFVIGQVHFYEGEGDVVDRSGAGYPQNAHLRSLADRLASLNDPIYLNGRNLDDVRVTMNLKIVEGRLHTVNFIVPGGAKDGGDYYSNDISIH